MKTNIILIIMLILLISCNKQEEKKIESKQKKIDTSKVLSDKKNNYQVYLADNVIRSEFGNLNVTYFGVSTLLFDDGETQILIDGFFSRPSYKEVKSTKISTIKKLVDEVISKYRMNRIRAIFVSHSHFDHALDVAYVAQKTNADLYGSLSTLNIGRGGGLKENELYLFAPGKLLRFGKFGIIVLESIHSPMDYESNDVGQEIQSPLSQPAYAKAFVEGGSYDFIIRYNNKTIYIKPSTNFIKGMLDPFNADILFLGVSKTGSSDEEFRYRFYQQIVLKLRPDLVIPLHWDNSFQPPTEELIPLTGNYNKNIDDFDWLIKRTKADNIQFKIIQWGKSMTLFSQR